LRHKRQVVLSVNIEGGSLSPAGHQAINELIDDAYCR
jgi:hypothetical protein